MQETAELFGKDPNRFIRHFIVFIEAAGVMKLVIPIGITRSERVNNENVVLTTKDLQENMLDGTTVEK